MKKLFTISLIVLFWTPEMLHAQLDTFDLSTYKLPVIQRKALDLTFNLNESSEYDESHYEYVSAKPKDSYFNFNNMTKIGYSSYMNNERIQSSQDYAISFAPKINRHVINDSITNKQSVINTGFHIYSYNRIYSHNQFFFEPDLLLSGQMQFNKSKNESLNEEESSGYHSIGVEIPLLVGKGRIEQVQDARLAVYILDELQKSGRLSRVPNNQEILELASLISKVSNERYFDYRLHKMYEIEKVDSFLQARAIVTQPDAHYFTVVNDNWDYAASPLRESGRRISAGIVPNFSFLYENADYESGAGFDFKDERFNLGMMARVNYVDTKPLNLKWQRDWSVELNCGYGKLFIKDLLDDTDGNIGSMLFSGQIDYKLGFYPNSRTSISGLMSLNFEQINSKDDPGDSPATVTTEIHKTDIAPSFSLVVDYYISPQLRFSADFYLSYNYTNSNEKNGPMTEYSYDKDNRITQSLSAKLIYSFF
jgi:hypothetical protein